ncbi:MAG: biotin/lipoyl-binding protein [Proteobacteria bacterium]|nr:biotin/lipoyl-binding protein [Pseudomonadota bacterium]
MSDPHGETHLSGETLALPSSAQRGTSLDLVRTGGALRVIAFILCLMVALSVAALAWVPWQQSVVGRGEVTVFAPTERPQTIEAPIPARIARWTVKEGTAVKKGELLCVLDDIESRFLDPAQPKILEAQMAAVRQRRTSVQARLDALEAQQASIMRSRDAALAVAAQKISQSQARQSMADQSARAQAQGVETARLNYRRVKHLQSNGLRSTRDLELAELDRVKAVTEVERARAACDVARRDVEGARLDRAKVDADTSASLVSLDASQQQAREAIASADAELMKLEADLHNLERRTEQRNVFAPCDGTVVRIFKAGRGENVKAGDDLCVLVPETTDTAVELYVSGFDAPLLSVGRPVRLIFDGFPAVPFVAWPWASVGTFAGRISVIDAVDDGAGRFRILVKPDPSLAEGRWPPPTRLRPGARTVGWVMLDMVPLYREVWRRLNAFPPTVEIEKPKKDGKDSSKGDKDEKKTKPVLKR